MKHTILINLLVVELYLEMSGLCQLEGLCFGMVQKLPKPALVEAHQRRWSLRKLRQVESLNHVKFKKIHRLSRK